MEFPTENANSTANDSEKLLKKRPFFDYTGSAETGKI